ncbi:hypothetical protein CEUSTIGMA_g7162.t1 [Chlamydomonas eustigma]|uniref:Signal recognition particle subunit SRP72 n=1 Tax=Chlamydomonas eustigma TaxID=1157962 RepID=A0A250X9G9_9CHLO|nr:hypothetical protein CEUSTIGMA_g7162.t1 [Chlamydomonas eustigma]|eukprot:GAX79721.1 hypothetical protein CEUSTIGMA_g7162.t1 [Chlamydomonas eustigma]
MRCIYINSAVNLLFVVLLLSPNDEDAWACKVVANMQLGNYDVALNLIGKATSSLQERMQFQRAYCLYRSGKVEEALSIAKNFESSNPEAFLQLQAQLNYRLHNSKEAIQSYDRLFKEHKADSIELKTNVVAAYVVAELSKEVPNLISAMQVSSKLSFELGFNKACALIEIGDFEGAETELRLALKTGREALFEEDCSEEELAEELAPITVQLGYVLGRLGRTTEALEAYEQVLSNISISEDVVRALAHNNNIAESGKVDGSAAQKKFVANAAKRMEALLDKDKSQGHLKLSPELEARLSKNQKQTLHLNRALLYLLSGRLEAAKDTAASVSKQYGDSTPLVLLKAALLVAEKKVSEADALLESLISSQSASSPTITLQPLLMRVQLSLEAGPSGVSKAVDLLSMLSSASSNSDEAGGLDVAHCGAVLATKLALYQQLGDNVGAEALLDDALVYWQRQQQGRAGPSGTKGKQGGRAGTGGRMGDVAFTALGWCLQSLVTLKLKLGKVEEAVNCYQLLQQQQGSGTSGGRHTVASASVLGRLIRALASTNANAAQDMAQDLPLVNAVQVRGVDVDALESQSKESGGFKKKENRKREGEADPEGTSEQKKKKRRKRKIILPKGYDPSLPGGGLPPPNPERWLPKWQRSEFKKKKVTSAQRKLEVVKGSQGAGKVDENLDRSSTPAAQQACSSAKPVLPSRKGKGKK